MSQPLPLGLAQQEKARPIDPDRLEKFGKTAASLHQEKGVSLNEAVVEVVKEASLSPEQVKRVCEFANTAAYLSAFEKAGSVRNVTFEGGPANPARILQDLNDGSSPTLLTESVEDYKKASASFRQGIELDALAQAFSVPPAEALSKTASAAVGVKNHEAHANPMDDLWDTRIALEGVRDELVTQKTAAHFTYDDAAADLAATAAQTYLDGVSVNDIASVLSQVLGTGGQLKEAMVVIQKRLPEVTEQLSKQASAQKLVVNMEHPLVAHCSAFTKAAHAIKVIEGALADVEEQLKKTNKAISGALI